MQCWLYHGQNHYVLPIILAATVFSFLEISLTMRNISFTCIFEFTAHNMQRGMTLSLDNYSSPSLGKWKCSDLPSSANMGGSTVNYQQSLAHIYHVMIIVTGGFSKIAGLTAFNFTLPSSQKRLQHKCFPENIAKFLRTAFFIQHLRWLLLSVW